MNPELVRGPTPEQRERVGEAARRLVELRDGWLNPPGVDPADLDAAVFAAYGWLDDLIDTSILERLLALNLEQADVQVLV